MASQSRTKKLYPEVLQSNPDAASPFLSNPNSNPPPSQSSLYPSLDMKDLEENLFLDADDHHRPCDSNSQAPSAPPEQVSVEELLIRVPGAVLNLIDKHYSVELASGDLTIVRLRQGDNVVAVLACVGDEIQWPLAKDEAAVKLDESHYFFSLRAPKVSGSDYSDDDDDDERKLSNEADELLNYGLTIASKGQESLLKELDAVLEHYSSFSVQEAKKTSEILGVSAAKEISPVELKSKKKKELMEGSCAAYWTTLAPNVEDYSGIAAKLIASGSGQLIKGILWCGDVTVERLKLGNDVMKKRMNPTLKTEISPETLRRIKRVKRMTRMSEKVATGVLSGVLKVSGFFTSSVANSKVGKKFFGLLPGEIVLASLDGFNRVCDALEVAGRNVMSTSSTVTTGLVSHSSDKVLVRFVAP
ncbi:protein EARLY-RESPONSIVE TO DEHYDRATION 7, chloroplastic-like isoform X2 [Malania oleifera]|uniref:protein EARLY-RESPONSIVE TO DEHYDRATION 7, chloroplastic-like isoform X2 n=1 Tax=Malania oleifera TaxID=397392 RepID=UPI0025AE6532|nr:protein EARLY-RESPONSIVE TO DEHYDRATION 7, chloroplastic-like isoform X2 [Malania oleifera]